MSFSLKLLTILILICFYFPSNSLLLIIRLKNQFWNYKFWVLCFFKRSHFLTIKSSKTWSNWLNQIVEIYFCSFVIGCLIWWATFIWNGCDHPLFPVYLQTIYNAQIKRLVIIKETFRMYIFHFITLGAFSVTQYF